MRTGLLACGVVLGILLSVPSYASESSCLGPPEKVDALRAQPNNVFGFVVRGQPKALDAALQLEAKDADIGPSVRLPFIDGIALALRARDAVALSQRSDTAQVWYLSRPLFGEYVRALEGLQYTAKTIDAPAVINLSLGPPAGLMPIPAHDEEPMNVATHRAANLGFVPVFAIGNYYTSESPNPGVTNPWCRPDWVICVGAANTNASKLYDLSARGDAADPTTWPDVVANGVDVISSWPSNIPKSASQKQYDEANPRFLAEVTPDKRDRVTMMSGTSQATAQVSRAAAQIIYFVREAIRTSNIKEGAPIFAITIPGDRFDYISRVGMRLTGDVGARTADGIEIVYRFVEPWRLVKQLIIDTAVPMPGYRAAEVGAGFVLPDYVDAQFGKYGHATAKILPVKVLE